MQYYLNSTNHVNSNLPASFWEEKIKKYLDSRVIRLGKKYIRAAKWRDFVQAFKISDKDLSRAGRSMIIFYQLQVTDNKQTNRIKES